MTIKRTLGALAAGLLAVLPVMSAALTIDNSAAIDGTIQPFGAENTATYGQTFTTNATDIVLDDFSLFLSNRFDGAGPLDLRGYLATWTGTQAGSILYTSTTQTTTGNQQFTFSPTLTLSPNTTYVAFLSISDLPAQPWSTFTMPWSSTDSIAGGSFVFYNNATNFGLLTSSTWESFSSSQDVRFIANFSQVPEPGTLALLSLGLAGLAATRRRRQ